MSYYIILYYIILYYTILYYTTLHYNKNNMLLKIKHTVGSHDLNSQSINSRVSNPISERIELGAKP